MVGDDHADVQGDRLHALAAPDQGVHEGVGLDGLVAAAVAGGAQALRLEREALADQRGVQCGDVRRDRGHAVLAATHGHVSVAPGVLVAASLAVRVGERDRGGAGVGPLLGACAVEVGQALAEQTVRLTALGGRERREGAGSAIGVLGRDLGGRERGEHLGHVRHEAAPRRERAGRGGGRTAGEHRDLAGRLPGRLAQQRRGRRLLPRLLCGVDPRLGLSAQGQRVREGDHGEGLEGVQRTAHRLQAPDHVLERLRRRIGRDEDLLPEFGQGTQLMGAIAQLLRETLRALVAHGVVQLLVGITSCRIEIVHCERHAPILPVPTDIRKTSPGMWITSDGEERSFATPDISTHISAGSAHERHSESALSHYSPPHFPPRHSHHPTNVDNAPLWRKGRERSGPNTTADDSPLDTARLLPQAGPVAATAS